jgi:cysteine synthase
MARARGHRLLAIVPNKVPFEKKVLLKIAGADLDIVSDELCPAFGLGDGSINLAKISRWHWVPIQASNLKWVH